MTKVLAALVLLAGRAFPPAGPITSTALFSAIAAVDVFVFCAPIGKTFDDYSLED